MDDFVTVATYYSVAEAEPPRLALESAGIPTLATDENIGALLAPATFGGIKLQVAAKDVDRANEILEALEDEIKPEQPETDEADEGVPLQCPECHAEIWFPSERKGHVEICPECGAHVDVPE